MIEKVVMVVVVVVVMVVLVLMLNVRALGLVNHQLFLRSFPLILNRRTDQPKDGLINPCVEIKGASTDHFFNF